MYLTRKPCRMRLPQDFNGVVELFSGDELLDLARGSLAMLLTLALFPN